MGAKAASGRALQPRGAAERAPMRPGASIAGRSSGRGVVSSAGRGLGAGAPVDAREAQLGELGLAFRRAFRSLNRLRGRDTHLGAGQLSHAQFELLSELFERGELPAGELASAARLTPATVTQMLEHLAQQGHVERARSQSDRRVVVSRLTRRGRRAIEAKREAWRARWEHALEGVTIEELRAATRVLERLAGMVEDEPPAGACVQAPEGAPQARASGRKRL